jgi:alpha-tubulin suppressor-like RCC1 family protein
MYFKQANRSICFKIRSSFGRVLVSSLRCLSVVCIVSAIAHPDDVAAQTYLGVDAGNNHTCAVRTDGRIHCWGSGTFGKLGYDTNRTTLSPVTVVAIGTATSVSSGANHTCARMSSGEVACWGAGGRGQLGGGFVGDSSRPVTVVGLSDAIAVSVGGEHSCALTASRVVKCWGLNGDGQLGDGSIANSSLPVTVSGITTAIALSAGANHTCAVLDSGTLFPGGRVRCWGLNSNGQLGDGTTTPRTTPVETDGITIAVTVSAGAAHTCVVLANLVGNGGIRCWGLGSDGQLGNDGTVNSSLPVATSGITNALSVSAAAQHTCALLSGGNIRCWGAGGAGRLGNGSLATALTPVTVTGINSATAVSAGAEHTCARLSTGQVRCWGDGTDGKLGLDSLTSHSVPRYIVTSVCNQDFDGNGVVSSTTDGLILSRALMGMSGTAVTSGALGAGATRTTWLELRDYLTQVCKLDALAP